MNKIRSLVLAALAIIIAIIAIIVINAFEPPFCLHFFNPETGIGTYYGYCSWIGTRPVWMFSGFPW